MPLHWTPFPATEMEGDAVQRNEMEDERNMLRSQWSERERRKESEKKIEKMH